jgi:hypothetical protein
MPTGNKNNNDFDTEYDFSKMEFGGDDGSAKASGDSEDVFKGFGSNSDLPEDFAGDENDDDPFQFDSMPDPNRPIEVTGNVDDEFEDVTAERMTARPVAAAARPVADDQDDDPFAEESNEFSTVAENGDEVDDAEEGDDPFEAYESEQTDDDETEEEARPAKRGGDNQPSSIMKYALPVAAVLGVVFLGYSGYNYVLPMFSGSPAPQQQAQASLPPTKNQFPTKLPGQAPIAPAPQQQAVSPLPTAPLMNGPGAQAQMPGMAQQLPSAPLGSPQAQLGGQPASNLPPGIVLPEMNVPNAQVGAVDSAAPPPYVPIPLGSGPTAKPPAFAPEVEDLVGGAGRSGIGAPPVAPAPPPPPVTASVPANFEARFSSLSSEVDGLKRQIANLAARLEGGGKGAPSISAQIDDGFASEPAKRIPDDVVPPLKPIVVEGVSLKGVSRDVAWVSTVSGTVEVKEGDSIPNAGDVVKIRSYGGDWIVVTTQGIVVR